MVVSLNAKLKSHNYKQPIPNNDYQGAVARHKNTKNGVLNTLFPCKLPDTDKIDALFPFGYRQLLARTNNSIFWWIGSGVCSSIR